MARSTKREWLERVRDWRRSGDTARDFCARRKLNRNTLLWWSSKVGREPPAFIEVVAPARAAPPAGTPPPGGPIEVLLRNGLRLRLAAEVEPSQLRAVVAALEAC